MSAGQTGFTHESHALKSVDWYTPSWIFDRLGLRFDLDPCQPEEKVAWIPAETHFSIRDDGLKQPWRGLVWLNPPYGKETKNWLARMSEHRNGLALVFSRTDCAWFHDYVAKADAILFLKGRIRFVDGLGVTGNAGPGSGSLLAAWGQQAVDALMRNQDLGHLVVHRQMAMGF